MKLNSLSAIWFYNATILMVILCFCRRERSGGEFSHDLFRLKFAAIIGDKQQFTQRFALFAINENGAAFVFREQKFIAPLGQGHQHRLECASLVGQNVFLPGAAVGGGLEPEDALIDQQF